VNQNNKELQYEDPSLNDELIYAVSEKLDKIKVEEHNPNETPILNNPFKFVSHTNEPDEEESPKLGTRKLSHNRENFHQAKMNLSK